MKAVFKISYYLRSNYKNKEGKCPIMIRISLNGKMCNVSSLGLSVNPEKWENKTGRMKSKSAEALNFNYKIDAIKSIWRRLMESSQTRLFQTSHVAKTPHLH